MVSGQASSGGLWQADDRNIKANIKQRQKLRLASHICYNELTVAVERTVQAILPLDGYAAMASGHRQLGILTGEQRLQSRDPAARLVPCVGCGPLLSTCQRARACVAERSFECRSIPDSVPVMVMGRSEVCRRCVCDALAVCILYQ